MSFVPGPLLLLLLAGPASILWSISKMTWTKHWRQLWSVFGWQLQRAVNFFCVLCPLALITFCHDPNGGGEGRSEGKGGAGSFWQQLPATLVRQLAGKRSETRMYNSKLGNGYGSVSVSISISTSSWPRLATLSLCGLLRKCCFREILCWSFIIFG